MIILDTHIWIWWVSGHEKLTESMKRHIEGNDLGISAISVWETAKLVEYGRLVINADLTAWLQAALHYPKLQLIPLTTDIIVASTQLTNFHKDPADQLIVATSNVLNCQLLTLDSKILAYRNVSCCKI